MIRKLTRLASLCGFVFAYSALSGGTNQFVTTLNQKWAQHNATNLIAFVDSELQARPNDPQVLFARAVVAGEMQLWNRYATNLIASAIAAVDQSSQCSTDDKNRLEKELRGHLKFFTVTVDSFSEATNSLPQLRKGVRPLFITLTKEGAL